MPGVPFPAAAPVPVFVPGATLPLVVPFVLPGCPAFDAECRSLGWLADAGDHPLAEMSAQRLAEAIRAITGIRVVMWDESGSTLLARETALQIGKSQKNRRGHQDKLAAVIILQDYLEYLRTHGQDEFPNTGEA